MKSILLSALTYQRLNRYADGPFEKAQIESARAVGTGFDVPVSDNVHRRLSERRKNNETHETVLLRIMNEVDTINNK